MRFCTILTFLILFSLSVQAGTYTLEGKRQQGGLLFGTVTPGSLVTLDAQNILVSPDGLFLLGFGRTAGPESHLSITYPNGQQVSETLKIKKSDYNIQRIDGLPKKKVTPNPEATKRIIADNKAVGVARKAVTQQAYFASGFDWPAKGRISGVFGSQRILNGKPRSPHRGVDVAAPEGSPLKADADGVIAFVHNHMYLMGKGIVIDHGHGLHSIYIHMHDIYVKKGQLVKKGDVVGEIGKTGRATGPHVHWGISLNGVALDPALIVAPMKN